MKANMKWKIHLKLMTACLLAGAGLLVTYAARYAHGETMASTANTASTTTMAPNELWPEIFLELVDDTLDFPAFGIALPGDSERFFLVERNGRIRIRANDAWLETPFLDIRDRVAAGAECGLLSMAFPPDFGEDNPVFYVYYSANENLIDPPPDSTEPNNGCDTVIARFTVTEDPNLADPDSEEQILLINQPFTNHNGGQIAFGADGMLYIGMGDGGSGGDPLNAGQRTDTLLGKMLRIQVGETPTYTVPADNPFVTDDSVRSEIWATGLRNPFRFSFDRATGDLYIADVGQNEWEEINFQPANSPGGENYGWKLIEGPECYLGANCNLEDFDAPVYAYPHEGAGCSGSVTGGYVYRGSLNVLQGIYIFGDYCTGKIRGLQQVEGDWQDALLLETSTNITSFAEDGAGNLYVMGTEGQGPSRRGVLYQILAEDIEPGEQRIIWFPQVETEP